MARLIKRDPWRRALVRLLIPGLVLLIYQSLRIASFSLSVMSERRKSLPELALEDLEPPEDMDFLTEDAGDFSRALAVVRVVEQHCENLTRPARAALRPLRHHTWHVFPTDTPQDIYVFSAFYDDRPANGIVPCVRVLAVGPDLKGHHPLTCQVWLRGRHAPVTTPLIIRKNGGGHVLAHRKYHQYYFTCEIPTAYPLPAYVSITREPCDVPVAMVPVFIPIRSPPLHDFGICVPVAFGKVDPHRIIEWVEANRLLGVTEINVYHVNMSADSLRVFRHYQHQGLLRLTHVPSVPDFEPSRGGVKIASPISLNDCMYRNLYRYRWTVVLDFDDLIVPRVTSGDVTLKNLLQRIDRQQRLRSPWRSYTFRNSYFWVDCERWNPQAPPDSYILRYVHRQTPSRYLYSAKSILDPRLCISVFNHYCYARFPQPPGEKWTIDVDPKLAMSHHYREHKYRTVKERKMMCLREKKGLIRDTSLEKIRARLQDNYNRTLCALGLSPA